MRGVGAQPGVSVSTYSMTGQGAAAGVCEAGALRVEVRSVNGRGLNLKLRLCPEVAGLEGVFDEEVRRFAARGTVTFVVDRAGGSAAPDREAMKALAAELRQLARELDMPADLSLRDVLAVAAMGRGPGVREAGPKLLQLVREALEQWQSHRQRGGAETVAAMMAEVDRLFELQQQASLRAPQLAAEHRERLLSRVREFVEAHGAQVEAGDLVREVAVYAERIDVSEELQRLGAHLGEIREQCRAGGAIGRRLEFLLQEALREANTLGSKSPDVAMAHCVIAMKSAIDRLKEQAANLE